jgi:hypothetical protein
MASNSLDTTLLKGSIQETDFQDDIVTESLTARCPEFRGEYAELGTSPQVCVSLCLLEDYHDASQTRELNIL